MNYKNEEYIKKYNSVLSKRMQLLGNNYSMIPDVAGFMKKKFFYGSISTELNKNKKQMEFFKQ